MPLPLEVPGWAWLLLAGVVGVSLAVDLVGHRGETRTSRKRATAWATGWIALSLAFAGWIAAAFGSEAAGEFAVAWLVEKSLSLDNLFVFLLVFERLRIPESEQHRVLFWGIFGALVTRGAFIASGSAILSAWHGVLYPMGAFLLYTGIKTAREAPNDGANDKILAFARRRVPYTARIDGHRFFTRENGRRLATPLFVALIVIELSDIVFAVDSIPAVFAITGEPFLVYSSNVFAILGLRALFLVLSGALGSLPHLRYGLGAILGFTGLKMLGSSFVHVAPWLSLLVIVAILAATAISGRVSHRAKTPT